MYEYGLFSALIPTFTFLASADAVDAVVSAVAVVVSASEEPSQAVSIPSAITPASAIAVTLIIIVLFFIMASILKGFRLWRLYLSIKSKGAQS